jgi:molybdenum cofactor cytidylyltransferase
MTKVGAVLLAAGASRRFGAGSKLVADFLGEPLLLRVARTLCGSGLEDIVVVTGRDAQLCRDAIRGLPVRCAHNECWDRGMGTSIAAGIAALDPALDGAFIVPGDMPLLGSEPIRRLRAEFTATGARSIVYPATPEGEQRNPVLWPRRFFADLATLPGDAGAKTLLQAHSHDAVAVTVSETSAFFDVDTPAELDAARASAASSAPKK